MSSIFKKIAINGLWLTADQFYEVLVLIYRKEHVDELGRPLPYLEDEFIDYVSKGMLNPDRLT